MERLSVAGASGTGALKPFNGWDSFPELGVDTGKSDDDEVPGVGMPELDVLE